MERFRFDEDTIVRLNQFRKMYQNAFDYHKGTYGAKLYEACNNIVYTNDLSILEDSIPVFISGCEDFLNLGNISLEKFDKIRNNVYTRVEFLKRSYLA